MGNLNSNRRSEETRPLLEDYEGIQPVFNELKLVLIGSHDVGKNSIGNEIFKKKFFSSWIFRKNADIKVTRTVLGREIQLTRTPGWKEYNDPQKTKRKMLQCVQSLYDTKPHAVLLALKVESEMPASTVATLEDLLSVQLWSHTIVVFTNGEKLRGSAIEDYITCNNLKTLTDKCGKRYFVLEKNDKQIIETIEDFIISKCSTDCFKPNGPIRKNDALVSDLIDLVGRIRSKINSIRDFKIKLKSNPRKHKDLKRLLDSKDKEIKRLQEIIKEKEKKIKRLSTRNTQRTITELEETIHLQNRELMEKDEKIKELNEQNERLQDLKTHKDENAHVVYCWELAQDAKTVKSNRQAAIQLHELPSKDSALHIWSTTLLQILNELSGDDLRKIKYYMKNIDEYKIDTGSVEEVDRLQLADLMLRAWVKPQSVLKTRDLLKKIPRNDDVMIKLLTPALKEISETW